MSEQTQTRAERELESWKLWAVGMEMLRDIHREIDEENSTLKEEEPVQYSANSKYQHQYSVSL